MVYPVSYLFGINHHYRCGLEPRSCRGLLNTRLCDTVCQWLTTGRLFSPSTPVSPTNIILDIIEIWLKMALSIIKLNQPLKGMYLKSYQYKWRLSVTEYAYLCVLISSTLRWQKYFTFCVHNVTPTDKNVLRLPITLLIFIIMLLNLDTIISKIWRVSDVISTCVHKT